MQKLIALGAVTVVALALVVPALAGTDLIVELATLLELRIR